MILVGVLQAKNLSLKNSVQAVANQKMIVPVKRSVQTAANQRMSVHVEPERLVRFGSWMFCWGRWLSPSQSKPRLVPAFVCSG